MGRVSPYNDNVSDHEGQLRSSFALAGARTRRKRGVLAALAAAVVVLLAGCETPPAPVDPVVVRTPEPVLNPLDPLLEDIQRRTFDFFWETAEPETGLVPDRWPKPPFSSIAAIGFALNAYAIGAERRYVTRAEARQRVLLTLKFLHGLPQGPESATTAGYQGFFYHFLNMGTGLRYGNSELSTVDTALFLAGALFVAGYFDGDDPEEKEIRRLAQELYERANWPWFIEHVPDIRMAWSPEQQFEVHDWRGYNEGMIVYVLALGSPTHPAAPGTWDSFTSNYYRHWGTLEGQTHLTFGPMFGHQYSAIWIDYRGIKDEFMWPQGIDYFENSRRAVLAQRAYAIRNPLDWRGYGPNIWGLTASDGPGYFKMPYRGTDTAVPRVRCARREPGGDAGRRHHRADGCHRLAALRAGGRPAGDARNAQEVRCADLRQVRLRRCLQSELRLRGAVAPRQARRATWAGSPAITWASTRGPSSR